MERSLPGPDRDILTKEEVCYYLRISADHLDRFIRKGLFPPGVPYGEGNRLPYWYAEDCAAFRWLRMRMAGAPEPASPPGEGDDG